MVLIENLLSAKETCILRQHLDQVPWLNGNLLQ